MVRRRFGARAGARVFAPTILAMALAIAGSTSSALAQPTGGFEVFRNCPVSNPEVVSCVYATTEGGKFTIGNRTVPITNPIVLQGGLIVNRETGVVTFAEATNGETLSKSPQKVPGGLVGIEGLGGEVTATAELAGPAGSIVLNQENLVTEKGTALSLPLKLKIGNPFLGEKCYGGSNRHPIVVELTTGTTSPPPPNKAITGKAGVFTTTEEGAILNINENSLVNNSFAAPGVHGCGFFPPLIDPLVDLGFGVPAAAGHNTAALEGKLELTSSEEVIEHS